MVGTARPQPPDLGRGLCAHCVPSRLMALAAGSRALSWKSSSLPAEQTTTRGSPDRGCGALMSPCVCRGNLPVDLREPETEVRAPGWADSVALRAPNSSPDYVESGHRIEVRFGLAARDRTSVQTVQGQLINQERSVCFWARSLVLPSRRGRRRLRCGAERHRSGSTPRAGAAATRAAAASCPRLFTWRDPLSATDDAVRPEDVTSAPRTVTPSAEGYAGRPGRGAQVALDVGQPPPIPGRRAGEGAAVAAARRPTPTAEPPRRPARRGGT